MPLLHIAIKANNENKRIDSELVAQNLTLIKASCTYKHLSTNILQAIAIDLPFISPLDYISSDSSRHIVLPFNFGDDAPSSGITCTQSLDCNFQFDVEHIPKTFECKCFSLTTGSDTFDESTFGTANGNLLRVDLFFHYETIHRKF
tara:strand:+ start:952 stop:1389 length:438 start_codon:yes stop_codon:yes gene_type:complete